jgi:hypothetical protein
LSGDLENLAARVEKDLETIPRWSTENGLVLNAGMEYKDVVRDLGVMVDARLRFSRHIMGICSKLYATVHRSRLLEFLNPKSLKLHLCKDKDCRCLLVAFNSCTSLGLSDLAIFFIVYVTN